MSENSAGAADRLGRISLFSEQEPEQVLAASAEFATHVALGIALGRGSPLVVQLLSSSDGDLGFREPLLEVEAQRNERPALLGDLYVETLDLAPMQKQFARAERIVIGQISMRIRTDMALEQPDFIVAQNRVGLAQVHLAGPTRFDLGAG